MLCPEVQSTWPDVYKVHLLVGQGCSGRLSFCRPAPPSPLESVEGNASVTFRRWLPLALTKGTVELVGSTLVLGLTQSARECGSLHLEVCPSQGLDVYGCEGLCPH